MRLTLLAKRAIYAYVWEYTQRTDFIVCYTS